MLIDLFEFTKLIGGIFLFVAPGFFWSSFIFPKITFFERCIFAFCLGLMYFISLIFFLHVITNIRISQFLIMVLYFLYLIPVCVLFVIRRTNFHFPTFHISHLKNKKFQILCGILFFNFFMTFLPHIVNNYYLPFHVDEWINWGFTQSLIHNGSIAFVNPFTGQGFAQIIEVGFTITASLFHFLSGSNLQTIFLFVPSILMVLISLTIFNIGNRSKGNHGLESAFIVGFIPTTIQVLGPSFFVAVMLGIFLILFFIWLYQLKSLSVSFFMIALLWVIFIVHPPSAFTVIVFLFSHGILQVINHRYYSALRTVLLIINAGIILLLAYLINSIWSENIVQFFSAISGTQYPSVLQNVWNQVIFLGILIWALFFIGVFYSIKNKNDFMRSMALSSILFLLIIGLYSNFGYGFPILFERGWLYLYFFAAILSGYGLHCLTKDNGFIKYIKVPKNMVSPRKILLILIGLAMIITTIPLQASIPYYQTITDDQYQTFQWIKENIQEYDTNNFSINIAAIDPDVAASFSAITGINTISSSMHPIYGQNLIYDMKNFLGRQCDNNSFLEKNNVDVIYGKCNNSNVVKIYENVYVYYGAIPSVDFSVNATSFLSNETIYFSADFLNDFGRIINWSWDFGDGTTAVGQIHGLYFDGADDYVIIPDNPLLDLTQQASLELWVKPSIGSQKVAVIGKQSAYQLWFSNNCWYFGVFNKTGYIGSGYTPIIRNSGPYQVTGVYDKNRAHENLQIWINGSLIKSSNFSQKILSTNLPFYFGGGLSNWGNGSFNGVISEVRLYNRALNKTEININKNQSNGDLVSNGLIGWWKLNQTGKYAIDSINGNNGLIKGAAWVNSVSHIYENPGTYTVNLSVIGDRGLTNFISKEIKIK